MTEDTRDLALEDLTWPNKQASIQVVIIIIIIIIIVIMDTDTGRALQNTSETGHI